MQADAHAERYVRLGLQLGRHADDIVDTYFGPPELAAAVDAAAPVEPAQLSASARALLAELDDGWLRDQVAGLGAHAGVLAGESRPYADAVEACYQLRPKRTDEAVFAGVHERLEELLPGAGTLHERYDALRRSAFVPAGRIEQVAAEAIAAARTCTGELIDLPDGEAVDLEIVHDVPWLGYCRYVGGLRSRISINADLPLSVIDLIRLVIHETYRSENGDWLTPAEVRIEGEGAARKAFSIATGRPVEIGPVEKMSKSRKNVVDPDDIIAHYGADTARLFIVSDSPPDRDIIWTEAGVAGAGRQVQRISRLIDQIVERGCAKTDPAPVFGAEASLLRRTAHKTLNNVSQNLEGLRYNVAVAQIYELTHALSAALERSGDGLDWAIRETAELLVQMIGPMLPHLAEDCWERLGYNTLISDQPWPRPEAALLVDDVITIAVQVNGKRRDELTVARTASKDEIEAAALGLEPVVRALAGRPVKKVIVVPQRIVNVVG